MVIGGQDVALQAARNDRALRALGVTPRKTIDTLIAPLHRERPRVLLSDRDFEPFVEHLGLASGMG